MPGYSAGLNGKNVEIDAGIKAGLAILLAIVACFCNNGLDYAYITIYLVAITVFLRSDLRFVVKNLVSYVIIIVFPYLCGLLLSLPVSRLFPGAASFDNAVFQATLLRIVKIFFIWYIGNLYFFTTPMETIMDMLDKVLYPLNSLGIPVAKHLNMVACIVNELTRSVGQFKQEILEQARHIFKNNRLGIRTKSRELSGILANFIANSLQQTDAIQERVELTRVHERQYKLRISKNGIVAILSFVIFLLLFFTSNYVTAL